MPVGWEIIGPISIIFQTVRTGQNTNEKYQTTPVVAPTLISTHVFYESNSPKKPIFIRVIAE